MYKKSMNFRNKYLLISLSRVLVSDWSIDQNEMQPNEFFIDFIGENSICY